MSVKYPTHIQDRYDLDEFKRLCPFHVKSGAHRNSSERSPMPDDGRSRRIGAAHEFLFSEEANGYCFTLSVDNFYFFSDERTAMLFKLRFG